MQSSRRPKDAISKSKPTSPRDLKRISKRLPHYPPVSTDFDQDIKAALKCIYTFNDGTLEEACQAKDYHGAIRVLHQVEAAIGDCPYGANKRLYHLHLSAFYNNKAYVLSELQQDEESLRMIERCLKNHETAIGFANGKEQHVAFYLNHVRYSLKYCALLSHAEKHLQAISVAQKCLLKLAQCIKLLSMMCYQNQQTPYADTPDTLATEFDSRVKSERVNFKKIVVRQAQKVLSELEELQTPKKLLQQHKTHFEQKIKNMYFWKNNSDNNARNIRKELFAGQQSGERNILGVQKSSSFLEQFSLSDLMSLDLVGMKAKVNCDTYYLLSTPKIIEIVLIAAVCYFTIATETRFSEGNLDLTVLKINEKYNKLHKDAQMSRCKILHLKAIELAGRHLPADNDFFTHLINSFNKNYKFLLDEIKEELEISLPPSKQINETYYRPVEETKLEEHTRMTSKKKKRSVSKDRMVGLRRKVRSVSSNKKL